MEDLVPLSADHPGFRDAEYRARRNAIARAALEYETGGPVPDVPYTHEEHDVWRAVWRELAPLHARFAVREYLEAQHTLPLSRHTIPQLREVNARLAPATAFEMQPVAGLVSARGFLSKLG